MKKGILGLMAVGLVAHQAMAIQIDFSNDPGTKISFGGGSFSFNSVLGSPATILHNFDITGVTGGAGDSINGEGRLLPGVFGIGPITTIGVLQTAPVTGSATLELYDPTNPTSAPKLTGTLTWTDISTVGTAGFMNVNGSFNVTSISYPGIGTVTDYATLASFGTASAVLTFQFTPGKTLTALKSASVRSPLSTSYSGSFTTASVPDGGATLGMLGAGLMGLAAFRRKNA